MIIVLTMWILIFLILFIIGFTAIELIRSIKGINEDRNNYRVDEYFFMGFLILSLITGVLSIFIPIGNSLFGIICILTLVLLLLQFNKIKLKFNENVNIIKKFDKKNVILLSCIIFFLLIAVIQKISLFDTELYHTQFIKWVRSYAVVPGLGNIHGRFAFNSMFFVISGLFTFEINDTLIYPLNGICFLVLAIRLILLYIKENNEDNYWKSILYLSLLLLSIYVMLRYLNSPSPDIICATLIIYAFLFVFSLPERTKLGLTYTILFNLLVFSCVVFKLSSLLMVMLLVPLWKDNIVKGFLISVFIGFIVITPFLIRNYFLSGYLIYPFPSIDIFNVDWKIPMENVIDMTNWIESWARVPGNPPSEVLRLKFTEWFKPWVDSMNNFMIGILAVNVILFLQLIIAALKKDKVIITIIIGILINLVFWFVNAPDPRFVYGFLIFGFCLVVSYFIKYLKLFSFIKTLNYRYYTIYFFLIILSIRFISYPINTLRNPMYLIIPAPFEKAETEIHNLNFTYRVSLSDSKCFNCEIPCTPDPLENVVLRGKDLSEGFKVIDNQE